MLLMNGNSNVLFLLVNMKVVGGKLEKKNPNIFTILHCIAKQGNSVPQSAVNANLCAFKKATRFMSEKPVESR